MEPLEKKTDARNPLGDPLEAPIDCEATPFYDFNSYEVTQINPIIENLLNVAKFAKDRDLALVDRCLKKIDQLIDKI